MIVLIYHSEKEGVVSRVPRTVSLQCDSKSTDHHCSTYFNRPYYTTLLKNHISVDQNNEAITCPFTYASTRRLLDDSKLIFAIQIVAYNIQICCYSIGVVSSKNARSG